jgi:hypothetical protein
MEVGFFTTWPGLTASIVRKNLPKFITTAKGHLQQEHQGLRSTNPSTRTHSITRSTPSIMTTDDNPLVRANWVYIQPIEVTGKINSNQTGRFSLTSSRGNKYVMIIYDYNYNAILAEPIKSRTKKMNSYEEPIQNYAPIYPIAASSPSYKG